MYIQHDTYLDDHPTSRRRVELVVPSSHQWRGLVSPRHRNCVQVARHTPTVVRPFITFKDWRNIIKLI
jgi:hypothetical protein